MCQAPPFSCQLLLPSTRPLISVCAGPEGGSLSQRAFPPSSILQCFGPSPPRQKKIGVQTFSPFFPYLCSHAGETYCGALYIYLVTPRWRNTGREEIRDDNPFALKSWGLRLFSLLYPSLKSDQIKKTEYPGGVKGGGSWEIEKWKFMLVAVATQRRLALHQLGLIFLMAIGLSSLSARRARRDF